MCLDYPFEPREAVPPERVEECVQLRDPLRGESIEPSGALATLVDESGLPQHLKMLRDRLAREREVRRDFSSAQLALAEQPHHLLPVRLRQRAQHVFHAVRVATCLRKQLLAMRSRRW